VHFDVAVPEKLSGFPHCGREMPVSCHFSLPSELDLLDALRWTTTVSLPNELRSEAGVVCLGG